MATILFCIQYFKKRKVLLTPIIVFFIFIIIFLQNHHHINRINRDSGQHQQQQYKNSAMSSFGEVIIEENFQSETVHPNLHWSTPQPIQISIANSKLTVTPQEKTDFWKKTYYVPVMDVTNAHHLSAKIEDAYFVMETHFSYDPINLFDQGGLVIFVNEDHWMKTGLEFVDGHSRLSCVVTNNGYSDWSTQSWDGNDVYIRVHREHNDSFVVEGSRDGKLWNFIRICHIGGMEASTVVDAGLYAACPTRAGGVAHFDYLRIHKSSGYSHKAEN